jgi:AraC-like DNA-binding protein/TolB-like protein
MRELSDTDRIFISKLTKIIHTNLENENFGVNELALRSGLNRKVLSRRLKTISGKSVSRFIRETRLNKALELLREGIYTVSEVGYKVGFNSPVYFTRCFHEYFGSTPGEVKKKGADGSDIDIPRVEETHKDLLREKKSYSLKFLVIVLFLAITVFFMLIIFSRLPDTLRLKDSVASDGKIPVVVMPFRNITGDSSLDIWENTIQQGIISSLSLNSRELMIRQQESVNSLLLSEGITRNASISPGIAVKISRKLEASLYIIGNIEKAGEKVRVDAQIIDTSKKEVVRSFNLEQSAKEADFFQITDTLAQRLRNWLLISKLIIEKQDLGRFRFSTNSPEALRYFIYGTDARAKDEYNDAIEWFSKALAIDSNFTDAAFGLENAYAHAGFTDQSKEWLIKNYGKIAGMDPVNQIYASYA